MSEKPQAVNSALNTLLADLDAEKNKQFKIKTKWLNCQCCGNRFNEGKRKKIIDRKRSEFETIKDANIRCIELKIRDISG